MRATTWLAILLTGLAAPAFAQIEAPPTLVDVWNTGTYPSGVAVDDEGTIYACHFGDGNIMVFAPDGTLLRTIGSSGSGSGQFISPEGIALDGNRNIYVSDFNLGRVQKFANDGTWLSTWSFAFSTPQGIAVDQQGSVYVADSHHIRKFDSSGNLVLSWGGQGSGTGQFNAAQGVAVDSQGFIYVADSINRTIQKFTADGVLVGNYGQPSQFAEVQGVALDPQDNLYVCDFPAYRVTKFAQDGTQLSNWSSTRPIFVAADHFGNLYVTSSLGASITKYSYIQTPEPPDPVEPGSIVISADNVYELYVNGELVGSDSAWRTVETYAVDLQPGDNVIAVYGYDSCCNSGIGLIAEIHAPDGEIHVTNSSWKTSSSEPTGWTELGFDDSSWPAAFDEGPHDTIPWILFQAPLQEFSGRGARWIWRPTPPFFDGYGYYNPDGSYTNSYFRKTISVDGPVSVERKSWRDIKRVYR